VICSTQIQGIYFLFDVLSFLAHSCIFVSPFAEDQPQNEMNTVMDQRTSLFIFSTGWFVGSLTCSSLFVVGPQEMVKQKSKNVQRKTIHQTENKYLEFFLNIS
jgi:hypothetical protein